MRSISLFTLALLAVAAWPVQAQDDRWQAHTSMRQITDLAVSGESIWAATTGGVFRYAANSGEMSTYTAGDGLHSVLTDAVAYDAVREVVWIGYRSGVLDKLDPETGVVQTFRDIERAERFASREIEHIAVRGDSIFIATSFGVVVFDPTRNEVRDTYSKLGGLPAATTVNDLTFAPDDTGEERIWLATGAGVAHASLSTANLQDPASWTVETLGLPSYETTAIASFDGLLYVGTAADLARRDSANAFSALGISGRIINDLFPMEDRLLVIDQFDPIVIGADGGTRRVEVEGFQDPVAVAAGPGGDVWVGDVQGGLIAIEPPDVTTETAEIVEAEIYPDGPYDNLFSDIEVGPDGKLWAAGAPSPQSGFYRLSPPNDWTNYIRRIHPELGNGYEYLHVDDRGHAWAGASGPGLAEVTADGEVRVWDSENSSLREAVGTTDYLIIRGMASDRDDRVWVTNVASSQPLHVYEPEGDEWTAVPRLECDGFSPTGVTYGDVFIDSFDQKWIRVVDIANLRRLIGLLVLETSGTPTETSDDFCRFFGTDGAGGQGLPGIAVTSLVEDRDGLIWIGTERGLAFMINNGIVARDPAAQPIWPQFADRTQGTFLLNGVKINDLAVDPANRLWVATDDGVSVVEQVEGGYQLVERITSRNSPLFSDVIVGIDIDPVSGRVYMATDQGMLSYESDAVAASEQPGDLKVYPNPARISSLEEPSIYIEGLVEATELRVLTLAGEVVARMQTRGGRARWDGRGLDDELVPSGMYLVVAVGEDGEGTAHGKVAVIR